MGWLEEIFPPKKSNSKQPVVEVEMVVEFSSWFNAGFYKFYALSQVGCLRSINQYRVLMMVLVVGTCSFMKRCVLWLEDTASGLESTLYGYAMNRTDSENNLQWAENRNIKSHNLPTHQILFYTLTLTIFFNKKYFQCPLRNIHKQTMTTNNPNVFVLISSFWVFDFESHFSGGLGSPLVGIRSLHHSLARDFPHCIEGGWGVFDGFWGLGGLPSLKLTIAIHSPWLAPDFLDALEDELNFPKTRGERCCRFRESVLGVGLDIGSNAINLNTTMKLSWGKWCVSGVC